jgi:hypothetical protein
LSGGDAALLHPLLESLNLSPVLITDLVLAGVFLLAKTEGQ